MNLTDHYRAYIACLNDRSWHQLGNFVDDNVHYNGELISLSGYKTMLENDVRIIPDLRFKIDLLVVEAPQVAARLVFNCSPQGRFWTAPRKLDSFSLPPESCILRGSGRLASA